MRRKLFRAAFICRPMWLSMTRRVVSPLPPRFQPREFDASAQDVALLKNISRVAASAHMPFIGSVGPAFFQKETMEEVVAIKDIGNHFERAEYIKWNAFRETDDARYIGTVMPVYWDACRMARIPYLSAALTMLKR